MLKVGSLRGEFGNAADWLKHRRTQPNLDLNGCPNSTSSCERIANHGATDAAAQAITEREREEPTVAGYTEHDGCDPLSTGTIL